ncbi:MAG: S8 family serine peptidase, partial [Flavobacteriales bacterium]|nr:S8 family serine peptidase [Flavobacteriales bacterium]
VIDDGVDIDHPDLEGKIWLNTDEIPDNGVDDDHNGYIDDVNGWNFLGNPEGENIKYETLEITRLYRQYAEMFDGVDTVNVPKELEDEYREYEKILAEFDREYSEINDQFAEYAQLASLYKGAVSYMQEKTGRDNPSIQDIIEYEATDKEEEQVKQFVLMAEQEGLTEYLDSGKDYFERSIEYNYNTEFDPRDIVNEAEAAEKNTGYGNNMVSAEDPGHGTHVSGIIAAVRNNDLGVDGIASNAIIMPIRAIPAGDERDKDVALAIRYAADNGAKVMNLSFGKAFSPEKQLVYDAIEYALEKDVLIVHAAGNEGSNNDESRKYPDGTLGKKKSVKGWITVGANTPYGDTAFVAGFSNLGRKGVDILAPGSEILSLSVGEGVESQSGTSMAAPVIAGMAAVLRGAYPDYSAHKIAKLIHKSINSKKNSVIKRDGEEVKLKKVVRYPGVPDLKKALEKKGLD